MHIPLGITKTKRSYGHRLPKQLKILKFGISILLFVLHGMYKTKIEILHECISRGWTMTHARNLP
jgi:hypothetical protein